MDSFHLPPKWSSEPKSEVQSNRTYLAGSQHEGMTPANHPLWFPFMDSQAGSFNPNPDSLSLPTYPRAGPASSKRPPSCTLRHPGTPSPRLSPLGTWRQPPAQLGGSQGPKKNRNPLHSLPVERTLIGPKRTRRKKKKLELTIIVGL